MNCQICQREEFLTFHHLIPRKNHKNKWFIKRFSKKEMRERGINLCKSCHKFIHKKFSEKELGRDYNTLDALIENPIIKKHALWASKQK